MSRISTDSDFRDPHLLHNQRPALQAVAARTGQALTLMTGVGPVTLMYRGRPQGSPVRSQRLETQPQPRHLAWVTTYEAIHVLHGQGMPVAAIARQLGVSRPTV
jgi:hypothetical protein